MNSHELRLGLIKDAREFRKKLNLSNDASIDINVVLKDLEVLAVFKPMSSEFSGMAVKVDNQKFMLINSNHSLGRQNFTVCHELYHLFIQKDFTSMICQVGEFKKTNTIEFRADNFAANFLMPQFGIVDLIPPNELRQDQISEKTLLQIESHFKCSRKALLHTLKSNRFITPSKFDFFLKDVKKGARTYGFDESLYMATDDFKVIGNYAELSRYAYEKQGISYNTLVNYMLDININIEDNVDERTSSL